MRRRAPIRALGHDTELPLDRPVHAPRACLSVTGPGAAGSVSSSIAAIGCTVRVVDAMNASSAPWRSSSVQVSSTTSVSAEDPLAGDRARMRSLERRRVQRPSRTQKNDHVGALEDAAVRGDEQRLVETALLREPRGEHVAGVREGLQAVEHAVRRVGRSSPRARGALCRGAGSISAIRRPPRVRTRPQQATRPGRGLQQRGDLLAPERRGPAPAAARRRCAAVARGAPRTRRGGPGRAACTSNAPSPRRSPSSETGILASSAGPIAPSTLASSMDDEVR